VENREEITALIGDRFECAQQLTWAIDEFETNRVGPDLVGRIAHRCLTLFVSLIGLVSDALI
jgi:hypothetical protein